MTYATMADLVARAGEDELIQVTDRNRVGIYDGEAIEAALRDADNLINGYVRSKYALPLDPIPDLVRTWATSIARHILHRDGPPDHVVTDYKDALAGLKDVARGIISLPVADGTVPTATTGVIMADHPAQVFTPGRLRGW